MSSQRFFPFFKLCALRIANLAPGSRSLGTYRTLVRQYSEPFGIRTETEVADDQIIAALELLWKDSYVKLDKWIEGSGWTKYSGGMDIWNFVGVGGFRVTLTAKGQELLSEMESRLVPSAPLKTREIGFHAVN